MTLARRWRDWPWATKLAVLCLLVAIGPLTIATALNDAASRGELLVATRSANLQRAHGTATVIDSYLAGVLADIRVIALSPSTQRFVAEPDVAWRADEVQAFLRHARDVHGFHEIFIADRSGMVLVASDPALAGVRRTSARYFLDAIAGTDRLDQPRFAPAAGDVFLHAAAPVRRPDGQVIGAVIGRLSLEAIDRFIEADRDFAGHSSYGVLWDASGIRLSEPTAPDQRWRPLGRLRPSSRERLEAEGRFGPATGALLAEDGGMDAVVEAARWLPIDPAAAPHLRTRRAGDPPVQVSIVPLREQQWFYGLLTPEPGVLAALNRQTRRSLAVLVITGLLALGIAVVAARRVSQPLSLVGDTARAIAAGDRTRRVGLEQADEIGRLAAAFDRMADALAASEDELRQHAERLEQTVEQRTASLQFLARASAVLAGSLEYESTLDSLARLAVPSLADGCVVDLADGERTRVTVVASDPVKEACVREVRARYAVERTPGHPAWRAMQTRTSQLIQEVTEATYAEIATTDEHRQLLSAIGSRSIMVVPLVARDHCLGALTFFQAESGRRYSAADLELAEDLAHRAAVALDHARLYRELREASRMKDEFLGTVSHELRTPLNALLGWAHMLRNGSLDAAAASRAVEAIHRNAQAQARLVSDLLDASRIITGKLHLDSRPFSPAAVVAQALESVRPIAEQREVRLLSAIDRTVPAIVGDPDRIQQVVWNLLSNAIKFSTPGATVHVSVDSQVQEVRIVVRDTGQGISPEFLPSIFEAFRQADSTTTRAHGGLGLGLTIAHQLVSLHGGAIRAESAGEGQGATFTVTLPVQAEPAAIAAPRAPSRPGAPLPSLNGLRVLIVDDEPDTREMFRTGLAAAGARVRAVSSAADALEALRNGGADILVADIGMPGEDGYSLIRRVRALAAEQGGTMPALAVTAYAGAGDRARALAAGFDEHVAKPLTSQELARAIAGLVHEAGGGEPGGRCATPPYARHTVRRPLTRPTRNSTMAMTSRT
jgi:signal transduction histidine kinase/DNA-binding NarL/FixJ family response regulator/HAMP domain-containing protein